VVTAARETRPHLTVVIPAHNEETRLGPTVETIGAYLRDARISAEIVVVDDGSTDGTRRVATEALAALRGRVVHQAENMGKGFAVRRGFAAARGRWVLITDADLSTPIEEHARLAEAARDHDLDLVIASRALPESKIEQRQHRVREWMGKTFNVAVRAATGLPFRDTQCGFKLMDRERTAPLFARMCVNGFAFDVELLFLAMRFGLRVRDVPVVWRNDPRSTVGLLTDSSRMLWDLARMRWRFRQGGYNPAEGMTAGDR
jgi:dolichyl-phosphate beta-glucosyltransferase